MLTFLFIVHFIADFLCQPRWMAMKKSKEPRALFSHLGIIWLSFLVALVLGGVPSEAAIQFSTLNAAIHGLIDWHIWKGYRLLVSKVYPDAQPETFKYWEDHWFYTTIGFDQLLHGVTIILLSQGLL